MSRLDRYIFLQIAWPFLFFVLVFTGVIWLALSLRIIDTVVASGQSAMLFLEFVALLIPKVLVIVLPVSAFAGTLYAINRLHSESEVQVMFASGISGQRLMRPVLYFSILVMIAVLALTTTIAPIAQRTMLDRINEIRGDVAAAFLKPGTFMTPEPGLTVYLRAMAQPGEMLGVFVHDERDLDNVVTYSAERAFLINDPENARLVMFDGIAQSVSEDDPNALSVLRFEQLGYDLSSSSGRSGRRDRKPSELSITELLDVGPGDTGARTLGDFRAEAHEALSGPLYVLALPLIALAFIIGNQNRRNGLTGQVAVAVIVGVGLRMVGLGLKSATSNEAALWPLMYAPPIVGILLAFWMLSSIGMSARSRILKVR
ncbi:LPS export ABC transporter permease LptF [Rhodobacteraceae bacterium NNCM2]|nr:LPS export ABC transporter permease LptF [Coraliihabitans acroporae]